jgi:hypothetical protein
MAGASPGEALATGDRDGFVRLLDSLDERARPTGRA